MTSGPAVKGLVRERYEPVELVGAGGQGAAWRARDVVHERFVALKRVDLAGGTTPTSEARVLFSIPPHAGLPLAREDFTSSGSYWLVSDWVDGPNLADLLAKDGDPGLDFEHVLGWLTQVAAAMDHLHAAGLCHRDVKPANIVVADSKAVLVDLGVASHEGYAGTPPYIAPEVVGGSAASVASDVYALAATAYVLLEGALPEPGRAAVLAAVPAEHRGRVRDALAAGLALDPAARPPTASALAAALTPPTVPTNLPAPRSSFIGRGKELAELTHAVSSARLVSVVGPGGAGKTRLVIEAARGIVNSYPAGAFFVALEKIEDPAMVGAQIVSAAGIEPRSGDALADLIDAFAGDTLLVVLDNCEHVIDQAAEAAERLLAGIEGLSILATSREPLRAEGEAIFDLDTLGVPPENEGLPLGTLASYPAVQLFADRAGHATRGFTLAGNEQAVADIARRTAGMPLAIELAAAQLRHASPSEIAEGLSRTIEGLAGGRRALPRHETMSAALAWSTERLREQDRRVFRHLGVFVGVEPVAAASVAGIEPDATRDAIARLADARLVQPDEAGRFRMLEPVRQFAHAQLEQHGELAAALGRHAQHYLAWAEGLVPKWLGMEVPDAIEAFRLDEANARAALRHLMDRGATGDAVRLLWALRHGLTSPGRLPEILGDIDRLLAVADDPADRVRLLVAKAHSLLFTTDDGEGPAVVNEAARLVREDFPVDLRLWILRLQLWDAWRTDHERFWRLYEHLLELAPIGSEARSEVVPMAGQLAISEGRVQEGVALLEEGLQEARTAGRLRQTANALTLLCQFHPDRTRQRELGEEAVDAGRRIGSLRYESFVLSHLGRLDCMEGAVERGVRRFQEVLRINLRPRTLVLSATAAALNGLLIWTRSTHPAFATTGLASVEAHEAAQGVAEDQLDRTAAELLAQHGLPPQTFDELRAELRARLGEQEFRRAWDEGARMSLRRLVERAITLEI